MKNLFKFGENVEGYNIPVLNEREVRAAAGIFFILMYTSLMLIIFNQNFTFLKYNITIFLLDFIIRVFVNPKFAPSLIIGRLIVRKQTPEYVGAPQKKFAWIIGVVMALTMFIFFNIVNAYSPITGIICMICLIFLFFESVFGICLGCLFYPLFFKEKIQLCPGDVCEPKVKQEIQKVSKSQIIIILGLIVFIVLLAKTCNNHFKEKPYDLFGIESHSKAK